MKSPERSREPDEPDEPGELMVELAAGAATTALAYVSDEPRTDPWLVLAHGAGAGQRSPFIVSMARELARRRVNVATFNFEYTQQGRRVPDRRPALDACYRAVIAAVRANWAGPSGDLFIGGKSMGGRIATHVAAADADLPVCGLVLLGYPLHPPGRPSERRDAHLPDVRRPMLIVQGERDAFGTPLEFEALLDRLSPRPRFHVVSHGDHSFKVPRAGAAGQQAVLREVEDTIVRWMRDVSDLPRGR